jgi:hypothetical protein
MDTFEVDVNIRVAAADAAAAREFVMSCLAREVKANPALVVMSVTTVGEDRP